MSDVKSLITDDFIQNRCRGWLKKIDLPRAPPALTSAHKQLCPCGEVEVSMELIHSDSSKVSAGQAASGVAPLRTTKSRQGRMLVSGHGYLFTVPEAR